MQIKRHNFINEKRTLLIGSSGGSTVELATVFSDDKCACDEMISLLVSLSFLLFDIVKS